MKCLSFLGRTTQTLAPNHPCLSATFLILTFCLLCITLLMVSGTLACGRLILVFGVVACWWPGKKLHLLSVKWLIVMVTLQDLESAITSLNACEEVLGEDKLKLTLSKWEQYHSEVWHALPVSLLWSYAPATNQNKCFLHCYFHHVFFLQKEKLTSVLFRN